MVFHGDLCRNFDRVFNVPRFGLRDGDVVQGGSAAERVINFFGGSQSIGKKICFGLRSGDAAQGDSAEF